MAALYRGKNWDTLPQKVFWEQFFRITQNQIVFGANYFLDFLPSTRGFVCWDKKQRMQTLSACELVWTSLDKPAKIMSYSSMNINRFHPTQKPIEVYKFMFDYCKIAIGASIFDGFLGSGSIAIACHDYKFHLTGCELDSDYFQAMTKRIKNHIAQQKLF